MQAPQNIFVGRLTEIEELERWVREEPNPRVPTRFGVLRGAAGSGKSAILEELDRLIEDASSFSLLFAMNRNEPAAVMLERLLFELSKVYQNQRSVLQRAKSIGKLLAKSLPKALPKALSIAGGGVGEVVGECVGDFVSSLVHSKEAPFQRFLAFCACVSEHLEPQQRMVVLVDPKDTMSDEAPSDWLTIAAMLPPKVRVLIAQRPDDALASHPQFASRCVLFPKAGGTLGDLGAQDVTDWYRAEAREQNGLLAGRDQVLADALARAAFERYGGYPGAHGAVLRLINAERPPEPVEAVQTWPREFAGLMDELYQSLSRQGDERLNLMLTLRCFGVATPQSIWREAGGLSDAAMSRALNDPRFRHFVRQDAQGWFAPYHALFAERLERELTADAPATQARAAACHQIARRAIETNEDFALEALRPVAARLPDQGALIDTLNFVMTRKEARGMLSSLEADVEFALGAPQLSEPWDRATALSWLGDIRRALGDLAGALEAHQAAEGICASLVASDPTNTEWQRDLSVSHEKIGDVRVAQGDSAGALEAYEAAMKTRERFAASDPKNTVWQRDLSVSHEKIGDVRRAQGDGDGALKAYETAMDIATCLAASDPRNTEWQRDLSVSHSKIGDVHFAQRDLAGALEAYEAAMDIATCLAASDPKNTQWQRDTFVSHAKLGVLRRASNDPARAREHFAAAREIMVRLVAIDPSNAQWKQDLAIIERDLKSVNP